MNNLRGIVEIMKTLDDLDKGGLVKSEVYKIDRAFCSLVFLLSSIFQGIWLYACVILLSSII